MYRTNSCNSLRKSDIGRQVTLAGWVNVTRDHGGVTFIDLRDREGLTQVVFRPEENAELAKEAHSLRYEDVIQVSGRVAARPPGTQNPNLATGDIEIIPSELRILNRADTLPFPIDAEPQNEDLRMTHRYFDLRRPRLTRNLRVRHRVAKATRDYLDSQGFGEVKTPFDRLTYRDAVNRFGSDKPDRRFQMELVDLAEIFRESSFKVFRGALDVGGVVKAINAKGFAGITIGQADELTGIAKLHGAKGLAFIKIENGEWKWPIAKFFSDAQKKALQSTLNIEEGDCVFFGADKWAIACEVLGRLRLRIAEIQNLVGSGKGQSGSDWDFLWVTDFPLFEWSPEENKWNAMHHPFTRPQAEDMALLVDATRSSRGLEAAERGEAPRLRLSEIRAEAYDVVLNGVEIGGGSIRIHEPELQEKMFEMLGISPEARESQFGHLLRALRLGAPPHGGIAFGLDRLVMLICGEQSIREVMAFPKHNRSIDLMTSSPAEVDPKQLRDLGIKLAKDQKL